MAAFVVAPKTPANEFFEIRIPLRLGHLPTQALAETVTARNAQLKIDGVAITKTNNTISDAIEGVTLNLTKANVGSPTTVSVVRDSGAIKGSVEALVKAYTEVSTTIKNLSAYDVAAKKGAVLQGDFTLIALQSSIRSAMSNV